MEGFHQLPCLTHSSEVELVGESHLWVTRQPWSVWGGRDTRLEQGQAPSLPCSELVECPALHTWGCRLCHPQMPLT